MADKRMTPSSHISTAAQHDSRCCLPNASVPHLKACCCFSAEVEKQNHPTLRTRARHFSERLELKRAPKSPDEAEHIINSPACLWRSLGQMRVSVLLHGNNSERSSSRLQTGTAAALPHARWNHKAQRTGRAWCGRTILPTLFTHTHTHTLNAALPVCYCDVWGIETYIWIWFLDFSFRLPVRCIFHFLCY